MDESVYIQTAGVAGEVPMRWLIVASMLVMFLAAACLVLIWALHRLRARMNASPTVIHDAVRKALNDALFTPGPASISKASALLGTLDRYLGPVLTLGGDVSKLVGDLKTALDGKPKPPAGHPATPPTGASPIGASASAAAAGAAAAAASAAAAAIGPGGLAVVTAPAPAPSTKEQVRQVREALEAFDDYWRKDRVLALLTRAQKALAFAPPLPKPPHGGAHH
jgi:hypothetical protein